MSQLLMAYSNCRTSMRQEGCEFTPRLVDPGKLVTQLDLDAGATPIKRLVTFPVERRPGRLPLFQLVSDHEVLSPRVRFLAAAIEHLRRLLLDEQRAHGKAVRRLDAFESAIRQAASLARNSLS